MNTLSVIQITGLFILAGIVAYIVYTYIHFKKTADIVIETQDDTFDPNKEKGPRVGQLSDIVSQINTTNNDIYNTFQQENSNLINQLNTNQTQLQNILNTGFNANDNIINTNKLISKKSIKTPSLNTTGNVKICGNSSSPSAASCTQFPNNGGNTYLKDTGSTPGSIILDGHQGSIVNNELTMQGNIKINMPDGTPGANISALSSKLNINTKNLNIGPISQSSGPAARSAATLSVNSTNDNINLLKLSNANRNNILKVSVNNGLTIYRDDNNFSTIKANTFENPGLKMLSPLVYISGNLIVKGKLTSGGQ